MSLFLTDVEIDAMCEGIKRNADKRRKLRDMGLIVNEKPNGRPLVVRSHAEAVLHPQPAAAEPERAPRVMPLPVVPWEETPLGRMQIEQRKNCADVAAAIEAERAALPKPTRKELRDAVELAERRRIEARAAMVRFHTARRRVVKLRRTPAWADQTKILAFYEQARALSVSTGIPHHVDHKFPLQGQLVSGLHVHQNLQVLTASANSRKKNRYEVEP